MLNAAKVSLQLTETCLFSKSGVSATLAASFFYLNVMNSCHLKPGFGFLTPIYPFSVKLQIFGLPVVWIPIFWKLWQDFRNAAYLQLPVTLMEIASSAPPKTPSLCSQKKMHQKLKLRNWNSGPPVKIKTSVAFHRPGLRDFCLSWCIWTRICSHAPFSFQTRSWLCFMMVDTTWLGRMPWSSDPQDRQEQFFQKSNVLVFQLQHFQLSNCHCCCCNLKLSVKASPLSVTISQADKTSAISSVYWQSQEHF